MPQLTPEGLQLVHDLSARTGFSNDAITHMLIAVLNGNGSMAQFSHTEFGGSGQWMRGGMTMIGDMFNNQLKGRVDGLCSEMAVLIASQPGLLQTGSFQSQSQGGGPGVGAPQGTSPFFVPDARSQWYPQELGMPTSSGSQNNTRYAYFASHQRLAVDTGGDVWVYNTLDHQIGGFAQQQGGSASLTFASQYRPVNVSVLPVVFRNGQPVAPAAVSAGAPSPPPSSSPSVSAEIYEAIEQLANLRSKGILTEQEFTTKKAELLARI